MKKLIFSIISIFLLLTTNAYSVQTGKTASISQYDDQCLMFETIDETVANRICGKIIVPNGSLTNNGDGTWSLSTGSGDLLADGTIPMTNNWDMGNFDISAKSFIADNATFTNANITTLDVFPLTPSSAPNADYEVANKKYVDDLSVSGIDSLVSDIGVVFPFDGENLSTVFVDEIGNASETYTFKNETGLISALDTSVKKFGNSSLKITPTLSGTYRATNVRAIIDSTSVQYYDAFNQSLSTDVTVSFWLKYDTATAYQYNLNLVEWDTNVGGRRFYITQNVETGLYCSNVAGDDMQTNVPITDLNWHHLVFYRSGNIGSFYLDGQQIGYAGALGNQSLSGGGTIDLGQQQKIVSQIATLHFDDFIISRTNILNLSPNVGLSDTYDIPTTPISLQENKIVITNVSGDVSRSSVFINDNGDILPELNNSVDIGNEVNKFKNIYLSGNTNTDKLIVTTSMTFPNDSISDANVVNDLTINSTKQITGESILTTGSITIDSNTKKLYFGDLQEASIYYDGTDMILDDDNIEPVSLQAIADYKSGFGWEDPVDTDDFTSVDYRQSGSFDVTLNAIFCETSSGSVEFDLQIDDGSPADINGTDIVCDSSGILDSSLAGDVSFDAGDKIDISITTVTDTPGDIKIFWFGTKKN
ncbi:MAG: LamG domain-containing protein [Novosphingobium sp.]|nr:LamG domain-containing protein [Novosphingobium sp.]